MTLINRYARRNLKAEDIYTFSVILCDNEIDRDLERFDIPTLRKLSEMFVGVTGIADHSMKSSDQTSRLFKTDFVQNLSQKTTVGEPYTYIKGTAYMIKTENNTDLIAQIDAGIKKEVSVSCSVSEIRCSVCNTNLKKGRCEHMKGEKYENQICHRILGGASDAYEWSFVAVPAQRAAGVTKSFSKGKEIKNLQNIIKTLKSDINEITLEKEQIEKIVAHILELEKQADDGKKYRKTLERDAVRLGAVAMPHLSCDCLESMCKKLPTDELCSLKKAFETSAQSKIPLNPQLKSDLKLEKNINQFRI